MIKSYYSLVIFFFISFLFFTNCRSKKEHDDIKGFELLNKYKLEIPESSGLAFDKFNNTLWTVSDDNSTIYEISFKGKILNYFVIDGYDIEGITVINDTSLAVVLERSRSVVKLTKYGKELEIFNIDIKGNLNEGLEGIAFNSINKNLYLLNEKNPGLLITLDSNNTILNKKKLNFASDFSGVFLDESNNELWIISDEAKSVFQCDINGTLKNKYRVDIPQIEGIAIDFKENKLFLVSDQTETLYIFSLP